MNAVKLFKTVTSSDPDLSGLSDSEIGDWIEIAADEVDSNTYGSKRQKATVYLAAHIAKLFERDGGGGQVGAKTSKSAGSVSETYLTKLDDGLDYTSYGSRFKAIRDKRVGGPHSVG